MRIENHRLTRKQVREVDRRAIEELGIPGIVLMENAARQAAAVAWTMLSYADESPRVAILSGGGNNGGDGYAMARHLHNRGAKVELFAAKPLAELVGDAATNAEICRRLDLPMTAIDQLESLDAARSEWASCDLIVDALFGTGMRDKPLPPFDAIIEAVTRLTGTQVLAVDIPSGLDCDTGEAAGACVQANATVTFVAKKAGFDNEASQRYTGEVHVADIGAPPELVRAVLHD